MTVTDSPPSDPNAPFRRQIYAILIAVSVGGMVGRIFAVNAVDTVRLEKYLKDQGRHDWQKQRPFLSSNDRSRWATVRSLVELGTYQIDDIVSQPNWDTIDMVKHDDEGRPAPATDQGHLYSSKPPLLATLMAGPYWVIYQVTGTTLGEHPFAIGRPLLVLFNVLPMIVYFASVARLVERFGLSDWGRLFVMACATFGTFLSTFAVTINNHLTAAVSAAIALNAALRVWYDGERRLRWLFVAGFFAAFTAANELPALAFFAAVAVGLLYRAPAATLKAFLPGAIMVFAAAEGTNYAAHHSWTPAYAHRTPGDNWYDYQFMRNGKVRDSYWSQPAARSPIDQGEPDRLTYVFHSLVGHHGIFSLSPIWLLSLVGLVLLCLRRHPDWRAMGLLLASVSLVCVTFYLLMPQNDRNYGGMTSGFRWVFWFAPLWLVAMLPVADGMSGRCWSRGLGLVLLGFSVVSVAYPTWNPWVHPWLLDFLESQQWVGLGMR
ncbi:MAG TPA: hypothetical protein VFI31_01175 [Pirellulales bacterium]|nr:hypothetical protein [Pirellulales bacterium]